MKESYVLGSGTPPEWCINRLMPYQKQNGKVGFEFWGFDTVVDLAPGDVLIKIDKLIIFERKRA